MLFSSIRSRGRREIDPFLRFRLSASADAPQGAPSCLRSRLRFYARCKRLVKFVFDRKSFIVEAGHKKKGKKIIKSQRKWKKCFPRQQKGETNTHTAETSFCLMMDLIIFRNRNG